MSKNVAREYASVWDAIADSPEEAANLKLRSELMMKIKILIAEKGWTQAVAAERCGISQPRINDLLRGRITRFSIDALVNIATALEQRIRLEVLPCDHKDKAVTLKYWESATPHKGVSELRAKRGRPAKAVERPDGRRG